MAYYQQILPIWHEFLDDEDLNCLMDLANTHYSLARCYHNGLKDHCSAEKEYLQAMEFYKRALENHRIKLNGYDSNETEMIVRHNELRLANMLDFYPTNTIECAQAWQQKAELKQFQFQFDSCLMAYQQALDIFLQQPYSI